MNLFERLFGPSAATVNSAIKKVDELVSERDRLASAVATTQKNLSQAYQEMAMLRGELEKTKAKLREQTDADLLLVSARIVMATLKGAKPDQADAVLQQRLAAQAHGGVYGNYIQGLGGGFGFQ